MGCLDEQTVVAFVSGSLAGSKLAEAEQHLLRCADCAALVAIAAPPALGGRQTLDGLGALTPEHGPRPMEKPPAAAGARRAASGEGMTEVIPGTQSWSPAHEASSGDFHDASDWLQPGAVVGRYRLLQLVGRGGMGEEIGRAHV